ncbi:MAG: DUF1353 domain-containing protein [Verrucomicrobiota bacterium]
MGSDLQVKKIAWRRWQLTQDFSFRIGEVEVTVPAGEETDYASIPRAFWCLVAPDDYPEAAVPHDWLYRTGTVPRVVADAVLLSLLREQGCPRWQRWPMYLAVRAFGWHAWRQHRKREHFNPSTL